MLRTVRTGLTIALGTSASVWRKPWLAVLGVVGVALGAAVVVAVDLASDSASRAHARALKSSSGLATHRIVGGPTGVPEGLYTRLRTDFGMRLSAPYVRTRVVLPELEMRAVELLGVDLVAGLELRDVGTGDLELRALLGRPRAVLVGDELAQALSVGSGKSFEAVVAGRRVRLEALDVLPPAADGAAQHHDGRLLADIATVQELAQQLGRLSYIDLVLSESSEVARLAATLPDGVTLVDIDGLHVESQQLAKAFQLNLAMMSKLALLIGVLLVYNTMTFSIIRRREQFAVLRALGVRRLELFGAVLLEALVVGIVAAVVGVGLGVGLATILLEFVARTLNDLYFAVDARAITLRSDTVLAGATLAVVGAIVAALLPAAEAAGATPARMLRRSAAEADARRLQPWLACVGLLLATGGGVLLHITTGLEAAFAALFALVLGGALAVPWLLVRLLPAGATALRGLRAPLTALAVDGVRASASRTAVAVAALTVALSATLGVGVMIDSFRTSVSDWLGMTLQADVYVSQPGAGPRAGLPPELREAVHSDVRVRDLSYGRSATVRARHGNADLVALRFTPEGHDGFRLLDHGSRSRAEVWKALADGAVLVSEPYARRHLVGPGSVVELLTAKGWTGFDVAAVYRDYGRERGIVLFDIDIYAQRWSDPGISSFGVYLADPAARAGFVADLNRLAQPLGIQVRSNQEIRKLSLEVFDRTFAITQVLRGVTVAVAFIGVLSALMALQLERARELAILRATGATRRQAAASVLTQTAAMGFAAALFAVPLGAIVGYVLVTAVNTRSFGWTLELQFEPALVAQAFALSIGAALLAGCFPAVRLARAPVAAALRAE
ncbi:MAG: ABC transporter permease [Pseudomonadota bacterium]